MPLAHVCTRVYTFNSARGSATRALTYIVKANVLMAYTRIVDLVMAYVVVVYKVAAYKVAAYKVVAYKVMVYRVMACRVMAHIVMAYIGMAYRFMVHTVVARASRQEAAPQPQEHRLI